MMADDGKLGFSGRICIPFCRDLKIPSDFSFKRQLKWYNMAGDASVVTPRNIKTNATLNIKY